MLFFVSRSRGPAPRRACRAVVGFLRRALAGGPTIGAHA
ncbi:MAG: hypothetical protein AVDCRST_MAG53-2371 [uncultured Solirubrobacteraceae bacterium]|uniref:Uncharacterized protein n=1 Tax=uncultured Solirubrobacteraceae bacterium TaxID=1162706 RepID=A0A6J4STB5_9ACTN|nr:MAG: hypothetical protein AVDCRST_MAG53-2371 [uncultured Solirubrobacteraceae bacterium]